MWRDEAACAGQDPRNFDVVDLHSADEWEILRSAAETWCSTCPVRDACAADADEHRHLGTWGGVYRRIKQGRYEWEILVEGACDPQVTDRRPGSRDGARVGGWVA